MSSAKTQNAKQTVMNVKRIQFKRAAAASLALAAMSWLGVSNQQAQIAWFVGGTSASGGTDTSAAVSYRGEASVASGNVLGIPVSVCDTGPLPSSGGALQSSLLTVDVCELVSLDVGHATAIGQQSIASSEASAGRLTVNVGGNLIAADALVAWAMASCCNSPSLGGGSQIAGLVVNGQAISVSGEANQTICLSNGHLIINEQTAVQTTDSADITVNALHIIINGAADLVISSAFAGVTCGSSTTLPPPGTSPPPPSSCGDFLTGGGWITGTPSGAKANFGVAGGIKDGAFWGHLNYIDHGNGMHVKATDVTGYAADPNDADCRIIDYDVTIDGQPGTARVRACDKGEPGRNDIFEIQLSNGYFAGGDLGGSQPGGGNIQLHKCK